MAAKRARVSCSPDSFLKEIREVKVLLESIKTFSSQLNLSKLAEAIKLKEGKIDFDSFILISLLRYYHTTATVLKVSFILISLLRYYHTTATVLKISFILISLLRYYHTTATVLKICSILISLLRYTIPWS